MSIHPEGKLCGHVRSRFECLFSVTLLPGEVWAHVRVPQRLGLTNIARHVIGCLLTLETRVHKACDVVARNIRQSYLLTDIAPNVLLCH